MFDAYREEAVKAGNPAGPEQLGLRRQVIIQTPEEARTGKARGIAMALKNKIEDGAKKAGGAALDRPGAHSYTIGEEEFIIGSPTAIAEEISKQCREIGAEHFQVVFTGLTTFDERTNSMEIYGREIIPLLGEIAEAGVGGARRSSARTLSAVPPRTCFWRATLGDMTGQIYKSIGKRDLAIDLYRPVDTTDPAAVIVLVHGGGWVGGHRSSLAALAQAIADRGYVVACPEYRLVREERWPAQVEDVSDAIRWAAEQAAALGVASGRVVVAGGSAGGHLALLATRNRLTMRGRLLSFQCSRRAI